MSLALSNFDAALVMCTDQKETLVRTIDLRSDTVTLPTPEMRRAIAEAALGDDVYGEDPTINRLEQLAAEKVGKAAAMLVVSGTMGNLCALLAHCGRGEEALVVTPEDALASVQVIEAAYRSLARGAWEPIVEPTPELA